MLATEDDCSGRSNSEIREGIDRTIRAYRRKTYITRKMVPIMGERAHS